LIIMDEATASVDYETDKKLQKVLKEDFNDAILLTIAHRLRTIIEYDRILVLDKGKIAEFDSPKNLLTKEGSMFLDMCKSSPDWEELRTLAGI